MSNYPKKIDGSVSLPLVRNNILEAGSDTINKIREAVINIERTLGTNPQGLKPDLYERLAVSIDELGNIKREALASLNILSGPIKNADVSQDAKIDESKINLEYSTHYLKSELTALISEVNSLLLQISDIKSKLEVHIVSSGAHKASSIDVDYIGVSSTSSSNITASNNLQSFLDNFINSHVGFSGDATESLKSHNANQIYIDTSTVPGVEGNDVQTAMESLSSRDLGSYENIIHNYIGSHFPSSSVVGSRGAVDEVSDSNIKISFNTYNGSSGEKGSEVSIPDGDELNATTGDFVVIGDQKYVISDITYNSGRSVKSLFVDGLYPSRSQTIYANFVFKEKDYSSEAGFLISRIRKTRNDALDIFQIVNPDSAYIIAGNPPKLGNILATNILKVETNLDTFSISYSNFSHISDLIIDLNDYCIENHIPILFSNKNGYICASNLIISEQSYLKIISNGAEGRLGFSASTKEIFGRLNRNVVIGRKEYSGIKPVALDIPVSVSGSAISSLGDPFYSYGVNVGSSMIIDNKRYIVSSFSGNSIIYSGNLPDGNYNLTIFDDTMFIGSVFGKRTVAGITQHQGSIYYPYLSRDRTLNIRAVADYTMPYNQQNPLLSINMTNSIPKDEFIEGQIGYDLSVDLFYYSEGSNKNYFSGQKIILGKENGILVEVLDKTSLISYLSSPFDLKIRVNEFNAEEFLILGSFTYEANGNIKDTVSFSNSGFINSFDLSSEFLSYEAKRRSLIHKTRSLKGLDVKSATVVSDKYNISLYSGTILINGYFVDIKSQDIVSSFTASQNTRAFVSASNNGTISMSVAGPNCEFNLPIAENTPILLLEYNGGTLYTTNMSKYHADFFNGNLNTIYVNHDGTGNCKTFKDAIYLAKKYYEVFNIKVSKIMLSSGVFKVQYESSSENLQLAYQNGLFLDFPVEICGQGESTVLDFDVGPSSETNREDRVGYIYVMGPSTSASELANIPSGSFISDGIVSFKNLKFLNSGVKIKNFTSRTSTTYRQAKVVFDSVTFHRSDDRNVSEVIYCYSRFLSSDTNVFLGNIDVRNCKFNESNIYFDRNYNEIYNINIENNEFFNNSELPLIKSTGGSIKSGKSSGSFYYNNNISGNRKAIASNGVTIVEEIGNSDYLSNKMTISEIETTNSLISSGYFESKDESVFSSSDISILNSNMVISGTDTGTIPVILEKKSTGGFAIDLGDGKIQGFEKRHFSNNIRVDLDNTISESYIFDFSGSTFLQASDTIINDYDARIRYFADTGFDNGLSLNKITIYVPVIEENNSAVINVYVGSPPNGGLAYSGLQTIVSATLPVFNGGTDYSSFNSFDHTDSYTPHTIFPNVLVDKESLAVFITIAKGSSSQDMDPFSFRVELEVGAK